MRRPYRVNVTRVRVGFPPDGAAVGYSLNRMRSEIPRRRESF